MNMHFISLLLRIGLGGLLFIASDLAMAVPLVCDANSDLVIDSRDITLITAARNKPATGAEDPRDPDRDRRITVADARTCSQRCSLPGCAVASSVPAPKVNAGNDQTLSLPYPQGIGSAQITGVITNIPASSVVTTAWSQLSGPEQVGFADTAFSQTTASFTAVGTYQLRLAVTGNGINITDDVQITVTEPVNTAPQLTPIGDRTLTLGSSLSLQVVANDSNPYDTLAFALDAAPNGVTVQAPAMLQWTPDAGQIGTHTLTVRVTDSGGLTDTRSFRVTVTDANQVPKLGAMTNDTTPAQADYTKTLTATDADGDTLVYSLLAGPNGLTLNGNILSWQPGTAEVGSHAVKISVADTLGAFDAAAFTVKVISDTAPVAVSDAYQVRVGETLTIPAAGVLSNDIDPDGSPLSALKLTNPDKGTLNALTADGGFSYTAPVTLPPVSGLNPVVEWRWGLGTNGAFVLAADFDHNAVVDYVSNDFGNLRAWRGSDGSQLWQFDKSITTNANLAGCQIGYDANQYALGDVTGGSDIYLFVAAACEEGQWDRFFAVNASQISGGKVAAKWLSPRLSQPHPGAYATPTSASLPATPITPFSAASAWGSVPTLAKLTAGGSTKLVTRFLATNVYGAYYDTPNSSHQARAACRTLTGLPADEGRACKATYVIDAATGTIDQVLTAPNTANQAYTLNQTPTRQNIPIVADLNGDGQVEIISGGDVWKLDGGVWTLAWQAQFASVTPGLKHGFEPASVAVADLDGDGLAEVIIHMIGYDNGPQKNAGGIHIFNHDGTLRRTIPIPFTWINGLLSVADADGDGAPEILMAGDNFVYAYRQDGTLLWAKLPPDIISDVVPAIAPIGGTPPLTTDSPIYVYDLNLDGVPEVILQGTRRLFILNGRTGAELWSIDTESSGYYQHGNPLLVDADNDGHIDILVHVHDRWNCNYGPGTGPVTCKGSAMRISGGDHNWAPGPKIQNQLNFRPAATNDAAKILYDGSVRRDFRQQIQQGTVIDPRLAQSTAFTYKANDGTADSAPATVAIEIQPPNSPPVITSTPPTALFRVSPDGVKTIYTLTATDSNLGDTVHYELVSSSFDTTYFPGPTVDAVTGNLGLYSCRACGTQRIVIAVAAVDTQGARTEQSFIIDLSSIAVAVPNVIGQQLPAARTAIEAASLTPLVVTERFGPQPAGTVTGQDPLVGTANVGRSATVKLTVSKGPQPVVVPNVVTRSESVVTAELAARGFAVQVIRQYSDSVPAGQVMAQNPPAGNEVSPGNATISVSLGSGLSVRLHSNYTTADKAIPLSVVAIGLDGEESSFLGATLSVSPSAMPYLGLLPSVVNASITPGLDTRGAFRVTATDTATGRKASAEFVVAPPVANGDVDPYAQLAEAISGVSTLLLEAKQANLAGDTGTMTARTRSAVLLWRSFDQTLLRLSAPGTPELGFMPRVADMAGFGVIETPHDRLNYTSFKTAAEKLDALVLGLRKNNTSIIEINNLFAEVSTAAEPLTSLTPGEYGLIRSRSKHTLIVAHLIPDWMDALMNDLGGTLGMAPAPAAPDAPPLDTAMLGALNNTSPLLNLLAGYVNGISGWFIKPAVASTLAEQLTIIAIDEVLDQINTLKKIQDAAMKQSHRVGAMVILASHIKAVLGEQQLVAVVAGASLSLHLFRAPYSMIEGFNLELEDPRINNVRIIGPDVVESVFELVEAIKDGDIFSAGQAVKSMYDISEKLEAFLAGKPLDNSWRQFPDTAEKGCIFDTAPNCVELIWHYGFKSVYNQDEDIVSGLGGIPSPIIFLVHSPLDGRISYATPVFIPYTGEP